MATDRITVNQSRLKSLLSYNQKTGEFVWIKDRGKMKSGAIAGRVKDNGRRTITIDYITYYASHLAFLYMEGYLPQSQIDHIDNSPGNNRWKNLRLASPSENCANTRIGKRNSSGFKGVMFRPLYNKWAAKVMVRRKSYWLGHFTCKNLAIEACKIKRQELSGEFARIR